MAQDAGGKLIWFLAGAAVGSAIALLYAPQSGRATRREIGRQIDRAQDNWEPLLAIADTANASALATYRIVLGIMIGSPRCE